jgi:membrane protein
MSNYFTEVFPDAVYAPLLQIASLVIGFGVITLLFATIYKILPDVEIGWSDVLFGAAITALLFTFGKFLIGLYIGRSSAASAYGAAGSLIVILLWIYYSAQIVFFGAEFTQVYTRYRGRLILPNAYAIPLTPAKRAEQGIATPADKRVLAPQGAAALEDPASIHRTRRRYGPVAIMTLLGFVAGAVAAFVGGGEDRAA